MLDQAHLPKEEEIVLRDRLGGIAFDLSAERSDDGTRVLYTGYLVVSGCSVCVDVETIVGSTPNFSLFRFEEYIDMDKKYRSFEQKLREERE